MQRTFFLLFIPIILAAGCAEKKDSAANDKNNHKAIDASMLDSSYRPGDDFFRFVNAKWIAANPIPADKSRFGSFDLLDDLSLETLKKVMEDAAAANADKGSNTQKVGDFWASAMDTLAIEKAGIEPLKIHLDKISAIQTTDEILAQVAAMQRLFANPMFNVFVQQDAKNSAEQILTLWQGGLGLPDKDYYLRNDEKGKQLRADYVAHIKNVFVLMGNSDAEAKTNADMIMKLEINLAKASMDRVTMRDPYAIYNIQTVEDLQRNYSNINWAAYFTELKTPPFTSLNVAQPKFYSALNEMVSSVSINDWKTYLNYHLVDEASPYMSSAYVKEHFDFYSKKLRGVEQMKPRWKSVCETADFTLGEALGQEYVKTAFSEESKQRMQKMVANIKASFSERINTLDWMSDSTKQFAQQKLNTIVVKVGYPDKWRDYSRLEIDRGSYVLNVMRCFEFEAQRNLDKIGQPVDKTEWGMSPQTVNAYYNPSNNEIVFPAAILQPPFFDPNADDAVNYAAIGAVIGHEITHGFDDEGRQYDAAGNLRQWWTSTDDKLFRERADVVVNQYESYCPLDSMCINGSLTLGENIADFGGLTIAYYAFLKTEQAKANEILDGFTPQQRFFIGFARIWAGDYKTEAMRNQLMTNPHSPGMYRVNGVVCNMPEFYTAFAVKEGDKLYRAEVDRARIW
ncbi:MAG: M13 family metallopeptidase [Chitinophagales bacterium]